MLKARIFDFLLFLTSIVVAFGSEGIIVHNHIYLKALLVYLIFSSIYYHLRIVSKTGNSNIEYGISYSSSFGVFTGPLGVFIFETLYRFTVYFYKKWTKTADPEEFLDTFYNIGSFTLCSSIGYYLYQYLYPGFSGIPFGFWILMFLLIVVITLLSSFFLIITSYFSGDITTRWEAFNLIIRNRSLLDITKIAISNCLLLLFLQEGRWDILISVFLLNYIVSRSFYSKSQSIQNKFERDKFKQMAYKDFLTGSYNRAYMDKKMKELDQTEEWIGIAVADIDKFKKINDEYNHAVGDQVIRHFADTLTSLLHEDDLLFRSGGEEFTIFLRNKSFEQTAGLMEQILHGIQNSSVKVEYGETSAHITYTASFGLYYYKINPNVSTEKGYVNADNLLLESKKLGRNRVSVKYERVEQEMNI
ncbi:GGDEF domain-containing protein [Paenibacillus sp. BR2-3]|uniref:GGDEF domain-containing protein n=1 Tax=Paenibacillus sp. BR2-3 TaxID=3048494 RepID=UPI00397737D5